MGERTGVDAALATLRARLKTAEEGLVAAKNILINPGDKNWLLVAQAAREQVTETLAEIRK